MKKFLAALALLFCLQPALADIPVNNITPTDCSGAASTSAAAMIQNSGSLRGFLVMNNSAALMCISFTGTAALGGTNCAQGSFPLGPGTATAAGGSFTTPATFGPNTTISIVAASGASNYSCIRW